MHIIYKGLGVPSPYRLNNERFTVLFNILKMRVLKIAIFNAQFPRRGNPLWLPRAGTEVCPCILSEFCYKFYYFEIRLNFT
jgi:hypothetical protein